MDEGLAAAKTAIALDETDPDARAILGPLHLARREHALAIETLQSALALNPSSANAHRWLGLVYAFVGRPEEAITEQGIASRLSPNDPLRWGFMNVQACAHLNARRFEPAAEWAHRALQQPNAARTPYIVQVVALSYLDRPDATRRALATLLKIDPDISIGKVRRTIPFAREEDIELWVSGLRQAGLPE